jgi:hypothetical protein
VTAQPAPSSATNTSNSPLAFSGSSAASKLGRRPRSIDPASVNCETARIDPRTSFTSRFIFPASSLKMRSSRIFRAASRIA